MKIFLKLSMVSLFLSVFLFTNTTKALDYEELPFLYTEKETSSLVCNHRKVINLHKVGPPFQGEGSTIAIIDSGFFDCNGDTHHALTNSTKERLGGVQPLDGEKDQKCFGHANRVASIIAGKNGIAPKAKLEVFSIPYSWEDEKGWIDWCVKALHEAIVQKVDFINLSIGWGEKGGLFPEELKQALYDVRDAKIGVFLAASNESTPGHHLILGDDMYRGLEQVLPKMQGYMRVVIATSCTMKLSSRKFMNQSLILVIF